MKVAREGNSTGSNAGLYIREPLEDVRSSEGRQRRNALEPLEDVSSQLDRHRGPDSVQALATRDPAIQNHWRDP